MGEENHQYMHAQCLATEWRGVKLQNGDQGVRCARVKIAALECHFRQAWGVQQSLHVYTMCTVSVQQDLCRPSLSL